MFSERFTSSRPDAADRKEAAILLEQARVALSDEKALQLLLAISDFDRSDLAGVAHRPVSLSHASKRMSLRHLPQ